MNTIQSSRGSIQWVLLVLVACLILTWAGYFWYTYFSSKNTPVELVNSNNTPEKTNSTMKIEFSGKIGKAFIRGSSWDLDLENNMSIPLENTAIYTNSGSRIGIIFPDRSIIRLDANSNVTIQKGKEGNIIISLEKGRLWARIIGQAWGNWKVVISLGGYQALIQWTSVEAIKLPLLSKYTVLDSSSMSWSESSGIDVTDSSGVTNHLKPENKLIGTEFGEVIVRPININDLYKNDAFALMNTQEDIVYLQDSINRFSGSIDLKKVEWEILASIPAIGSNESAIFLSGTSFDATTLSWEISSQEWSKMTQQVLTERMLDYNSLMEKNEAYINQVYEEQGKLRDSLLRSTGEMLDQTKEMVNWIILDQEFLISHILIQNWAFLEKINADMATLMDDQQKMLDWIMKDTMGNLNTTLTNINVSTMSWSPVNESDDSDNATTDIESDPFFADTWSDNSEGNPQIQETSTISDSGKDSISNDSDGSQSNISSDGSQSMTN